MSLSANASSPIPASSAPLLQAEGVTVRFDACERPFDVVRDVSFTLHPGRTLCLVGESGCGKSTVARAIMGIYTPTEGEIYFKDFLISEKRSYREHKKDIQRNMQVIFQDSAAALNPRMKVADIIAEPLVINRVYPDKVR